jgi:glycerol kinase
MLFNIHTGAWDSELLDLFRVPASIMPAIRSSSEVYAQVSGVEGLNGVALAGIAGDQQAALFGQRCTKPGLTKNTYGTGCFMLQNTGRRAVPSSNRLVTTVAWKLGEVTEYALEGSVFVGGAVVQWLREGLGLIRKSEDVEALAKSVPDNGGVYFVPAFVGLGAPHWDASARGTIVGLTRGTGRAEIVRAAVEAMAFQTRDVVEAMEQDSGQRLQELRVDGGAAVMDVMCQLQSDLLGIPVRRPRLTETTALGAAYLAGLGAGLWTDADLAGLWKLDREFTPRMSRDEADSLQHGWRRAVERSRGWLDRDNQ